MNELALFSGAGGGILGGMLLGWRTVAAVEIEDYPRRVLLQRQADGILPRFPIWDDICTFDGKPWRGKVDVISGGFPCQDISSAGKGAGITGERSGLWKEMARVIREVRPRFAFVENSRILTSRGLGVVLGDLAEMGYDAEWGVLGAHHAGAPHKRDRIWILAYTNCELLRQKQKLGAKCQSTSQSANNGKPEYMANATSARLGGSKLTDRADLSVWQIEDGSDIECRSSWWAEDPADIRNAPEQGLQDGRGSSMGESGTESESKRPSGEATLSRSIEPEMGRVAYGMAYRVDRLKTIGNGQVPAVAALAWRILSEGLDA
jgi:DNA (cytosine-5)-methyltransferase 1